LILLWSPDAFSDLTNEYRYLVGRNRTGAQNQVRRIRRAARALLTFPRIGAQVTFDEQPAFVFAVPGSEYLLIYDIAGDVVRIRRVWSGRRANPPFERPG
jgi:plasmid stabilization system protein ParE